MNYNCHQLKLCIAALPLLGACENTRKENSAQDSPHILLLLADDMGYAELGCYGQEVIQTPVLDSLAAHGRQYMNFYAGNALSSPSRAVLMTGKDAGCNTIRAHAGYFEERDMWTRIALTEKDTTIAQVLKGAGYQTFMVGKWHLDVPYDTTTWAHAKGFDYVVQEQWGKDRSGRCFGVANREYFNGLQDSIYFDHTMYDSKDHFRTNIAIDYVDHHLNPDQPFFMYMSYRAPHAFESTIKYEELFKDKDWPVVEKQHAAKIQHLDKHIGRLLKHMNEKGLLENTLIIFMSDNGGYDGPHDSDFFKSNGIYRGVKRDTYEGGIIVPCIAYWKGKIQPSVTYDMGHFSDIMPTFAELAGAKCPEGVTGISLVHSLLGQTFHTERSLYWEIIPEDHSFRQAVRHGHWKAVRYGTEGKIQLYDMNNDPSEKNDLSAEYPEIVKEMEQLIHEKHHPSRLYPMDQLKKTVDRPTKGMTFINPMNKAI